MSAAAFVLAINIFVSGLFSAAFGVVAWRNGTAIGARLLALAYGIGIVNAGLEFVLPTQQDTALLELAMFSISLSAFMICVVGLARHYSVAVPWVPLAVLGLVSIVANAVLLFQPIGTPLERAIVYQFPYFGAHLLGAAMVFNSRRRAALDLTLLVFLVVSGLQFVAKPFLAAGLGHEGTAGYLQSLYGAYSQTFVAFLLIANGVLMLLIMVRDEMAEITIRSETDKLSGLLNRRGFEDRAERAMASARRAGVSSALVLADLDHFKAINDTLGHDRGDAVIASFARLLARDAEDRMVVGRQGGEEFAVLIPGANLASARLYAEGVRIAFSALAGDIGVATLSASFGVVQVRPEDTLLDLLRRADLALYDAKKNGRDRVSVAGHVEPAMPTLADAPQRRTSESSG